MVRKRMIRIAAWLLIGILCAGSIPMTTKAEEPLHILALGDSIALVQKFLNKWTIFLFCSILFSSNQKEH